MKFTKMHGLGNDFIIIDCLKDELKAPEKVANKICRRHHGIGADGLIMMLPSKKADFKMRIFNPDGSEAEMCGNGIRCFAKYVYDYKLTEKKKFDVETLAGIIKPEIAKFVGGKAHMIRVDMGEPILERSKIPMRGPPGKVINEVLELDDRTLKLGNKELNITAVSMGNPHAVIFVDTYDFPTEQVGKDIEEHKAFPKRTNVEFVQVVNRNELNMEVWERGAGVTLACGTGASAALVAAVLNKKTDRKAVVHLLGGDLDIEWASDNHVYLTGPAEEVYSGEIEI